MFDNLTYKKKVNLLIVVAIVFALIAYSLAFKKTIRLFRDYKASKKKMELVENAPQKISKMELELKNLEYMLGAKDTSARNTRQLILEKTASYCQENNIILREILQPVNIQQTGYNIELNVIILEGGYLKLLNFIYLMEKNKVLGKISSVKFAINKNPLTKEKKLQSTLYIQKINKK